MLLLVALPACQEAQSLYGTGLHLRVRAAEAQLRSGALQGDEGGPAVTQVLRPQPLVERGEAGVILEGRLGPGGVALHLQAEGDPDHWHLAPKGFDFVVNDELQWTAELEFSHAIQEDEITVFLQAADEQGRLGPVEETTFTLEPELPPSKLLVSLGWDAPVDLDLHVELPDGTVVGSKNLNSYDAPLSPIPGSEEWKLGGWLDYDSNKGCVLDLRNQENVLWIEGDPPPGHYKVYANLYSACDAHAVNFEALVHEADELIVRAGSTLYEFDARTHPDPEEAPGLLLVEFDIP
jgi:hypothetical protein